MTDYKLSGYWRRRGETAIGAATRLAQMLERLVTVHPVFSRWNQKADTREEADEPFCTMPPRIEELINTVAATQDSAVTSPDEKLWSFSLSAWNGREDGFAAMFIIHAGESGGYQAEPNSIRFQLPETKPKTADVFNTNVLKRLLLAAAIPWEADWAVIETPEYRGMLKDADGYPLHPWGGWITYLCPAYARMVIPPSSVVVEQVSDGGILLFATEAQFNADDPAHVAAADAIQACLEPVQKIVLTAKKPWQSMHRS
jgi:hypothetical protein